MSDHCSDVANVNPADGDGGGIGDVWDGSVQDDDGHDVSVDGDDADLSIYLGAPEVSGNHRDDGCDDG